MKIMKTPGSCSAFVLIALAIVLAGCVTKRIVWSPDGRHGAVLGEKGLYLCDADGKLSGLLVPDVVDVEWFPDSQRLALTRVEKVKSWTELQTLLSPEARDRIVHGGQVVLDELKAGHQLEAAFKSTKSTDENEIHAMALYLRNLDGVKEQVGSNWAALDVAVDKIVLQIGTLTNSDIALGLILLSSIDGIGGIRVAPGGTAIAVLVPAGHDTGTLKVLSADGSTSRVIAEHVAQNFDWTADGALIYIKSVGAETSNDQIMLGSLTRRRVLDQSGRFELSDKEDELAGMVFDPTSKVRCVADGRIIFSAMEVRLPTTKEDVLQHQQLFALDPEKQATLVRLIPQGVLGKVPENVNPFEVSPDGKRVSMLGEKHCVVILTLATGTVETVQTPTESDIEDCLPVWRSTNELCFVSITKSNNVALPAELALWSDGKTRILSGDWPQEVRKGFLDK